MLMTCTRSLPSRLATPSVLSVPNSRQAALAARGFRRTSSTLGPERRASNLAPPSRRGSGLSAHPGSRRNSAGSHASGASASPTGVGPRWGASGSRLSIDSDLASLPLSGVRRPSISRDRRQSGSRRLGWGPLCFQDSFADFATPLQCLKALPDTSAVVLT